MKHLLSIQVEQFQELKTLLGSEYFKQNVEHRLRGCVGIVALKVLSVNEFIEAARSLRDAAEGRQTSADDVTSRCLELK